MTTVHDLVSTLHGSGKLGDDGAIGGDVESADLILSLARMAGGDDRAT